MCPAAKDADPSAPPAHESMHCRSNSFDPQPILIGGKQHFCCCYCCPAPEHTQKTDPLPDGLFSHWVLIACDASYTLTIPSCCRQQSISKRIPDPAQQQHSTRAVDPLLLVGPPRYAEQTPDPSVSQPSSSQQQQQAFELCACFHT